jgi:hypothetical protein
VTWRSLNYTSHVWVYDLVSLPSEISTLGYFQEDMEEYPGVYIMEDMTEDIRYAGDVAEDVGDAVDPYRSRSNQGTVIGLQEHGGRPHRPIDHRLWDIPTNVPDTFVYHVYPYDPESFQSHIPLHHPQR